MTDIRDTMAMNPGMYVGGEFERAADKPRMAKIKEIFESERWPTSSGFGDTMDQSDNYARQHNRSLIRLKIHVLRRIAELEDQVKAHESITDPCELCKHFLTSTGCSPCNTCLIVCRAGSLLWEPK